MFSCKLLTKKDLSHVIEFLSDYEQTCVSLMSHLLKEGEPVMPNSKLQYWIIRNQLEKISGVIMISSSGLVLHCFSDQLLQEKTNLDLGSVQKILQESQLYCIMGQKEGTSLVQSLYGKKIRTVREYEMLVYSDNINQFDRFEQQLLEISLHRCTDKDLQLLLPLQREYDLVEVIPDGDSLDELICRSNLKRLLLTQEIFAIKEGQSFIAKAGTNAQGLNWVQIGGVFTHSQWRGRGLAKLLVAYTAHTFSKRGKKVCLFVRTNNVSAKKVYNNVGFLFDSQYTIVYY